MEGEEGGQSPRRWVKSAKSTQAAHAVAGTLTHKQTAAEGLGA